MDLPINFFSRQYIRLVESIRSTPDTEEYLEGHHVYPKAIYGPTEDILHVSYRHHVILHYLLWRCFDISEDKNAATKMLSAVKHMLYEKGGNVSGRQKLTEDFLEKASRARSRVDRAHAAAYSASSSQRMKEFWADPARKAARLARIKEAISTEASYKKRAAATEKRRSAPGYKERCSEHSRAIWQDKEVLAKAVASRKRYYEEAKKDPEFVEYLSARSSAIWTDPERKARAATRRSRTHRLKKERI